MSTEKNPSLQTFLRLVHERFGGFKSRLQELVNALAGNEKDQKVAAAKAALDAANGLRAALASSDQPEWLVPFIQALTSFVNRDGNYGPGRDLLEVIGQHYRAVFAHTWTFDLSGDRGFDFDGVFRKYEAESRLADLFDQLVELLDKIVECDGVDSRRVIQNLETIIATLKKNRKGSYFGVMGTWDFASTYIRNVAWNVLEEVPILKTLVTSLRETMDELNTEMGTLHENMCADLGRQLQAEFPVLAYHPIRLPAPLAFMGGAIVDAECNPVRSEEPHSSQ